MGTANWTGTNPATNLGGLAGGCKQLHDLPVAPRRIARSAGRSRGHSVRDRASIGPLPFRGPSPSAILPRLGLPTPVRPALARIDPGHVELDLKQVDHADHPRHPAAQPHRQLFFVVRPDTAPQNNGVPLDFDVNRRRPGRLLACRNSRNALLHVVGNRRRGRGLRETARLKEEVSKPARSCK